jgi:hypothetical protein
MWPNTRGAFWDLLDKCIAHRWGCRELRDAVQRSTGRRSAAGRRPRVRDLEEAVQKILGWCEEWSRLREVTTGSADGEIEQAIANLLPGRLRRQIPDVNQSVTRLYRTALTFRKSKAGTKRLRKN